MKISILHPLFSILVLAAACSAQVEWNAETDTNGNFLWPPVLPAAQLSPFSNSIPVYDSSGTLRDRLGNDGTFSFTNASGLVISSTSTNFTVADTNGGFGYSNGVFWVSAKTAGNLLSQHMQSGLLTFPAGTNTQPYSLATPYLDTNYAVFLTCGVTTTNFALGARITGTNNFTIGTLGQGTNYLPQNYFWFTYHP
jgi:hypothetical protein